MTRVRDGSAAQAINSVHVRDGAGLSAIGKIRVRDSSGLNLVWSNSGALAISPDAVSGYGSSNSTIFVTSYPAEIVGAPSGATIVWHSDNAAVTIVSPSSISTVFRAHLASGVTQTANVYATVNGAATAPIGVELTNGGIA